ISQFYPNAYVEKYAIMPNHIHMILLLTENSGSAARSPTVSTIINQLKGFITKQVGYSIWQTSFYDHIIRNDEEHRLVWDYIDANPINWRDDHKFGS
ncbi:MAG: transposase, partial [Bellilinea sp.]